jgi:NAD(P)-dependent dehydrogenase (short-subunit alcohol dehydrogenase family)
LASRTQSNIDAVGDKIKAKYPSVTVETLILDLSSQKSVRAAAQDINGRTSKLDVLINNAGVMSIPTRTLSEDGIELHFATNHIGHFLFTNLVLEKLRAAAKGATPGATRVVMVTSNGHRFSPVRFHDWNFDGKAVPPEEEPGAQAMKDRGMPPPNMESGYDRFVAYGQSKAANILFALYLRSKLAKDGIQSISVHPGSESL